MKDRSFKVALLVGALAALTTADALAQQVRIKGKFKSAASATEFTVDDDKMVELNIVAGPRSTLVVEGTAEPGFLAANQVVEFVADMKKGNILTAPLSQITICSLTQFDPATLSLEDPTKPSKKGATAVNRYIVRGTLKSLRMGKFTVMVPPSQQIKGELADDAKILVKVADATWAQPGDEVDVQGSEGRPGTISVRTAKIKLSKPLEGKDPKKKGK
jgi:hypothetical protein